MLWLDSGDAKFPGLRKKQDWNTLRISAKGPRLHVFLNGTQICDVKDNPTDPAEAKWKEAGPISVQSPYHWPGSTGFVKYRNMRDSDALTVGWTVVLRSLVVLLRRERRPRSTTKTPSLLISTSRSACTNQGSARSRVPISSTNREAQAYFSQGFQLMYAFAKTEAGRSFREAQKRDPNCAICYWGEAWAWGPYVNGRMTVEHAGRAYAAIRKAIALADAHADAKEQALIRAMAVAVCRALRPGHAPRTGPRVCRRHGSRGGVIPR